MSAHSTAGGSPPPRPSSSWSPSRPFRLKNTKYFSGATRGILASFVGLLCYMTIKFAVAVPWDVVKVLFGIAVVGQESKHPPCCAGRLGSFQHHFPVKENDGDEPRIDLPPSNRSGVG